MKANNYCFINILLIFVGSLVSELIGALQCPRVVDLKHHSLIVECTAPNGTVSPCTSEMPIGTTLKYYCDKDVHFRLRSHHEQNKFQVFCDDSSRWTNYEHLKDLQCVQECGPTASDSPRLWELHLKNKMSPISQPCMGTLIPALSIKSRSFIITSMKCVSKPHKGPVLSPEELVVTLPKRPYSETPEFQVKKIYLPPSGENIALVRLENTIAINPSVKPICLPFDLTPQMYDSPNRPIEHGQVLGFGNSTLVSKISCSIFDLPDVDKTKMEFCADRTLQDGSDCIPIFGPFVTVEPAVYDAYQNVSTLRGIFGSALTRDTCKSGFLFTSIATPSVIKWIRETVHKAEGSAEYTYSPPRSPVTTSSHHHHHNTRGQHHTRPRISSTTVPNYMNPEVYYSSRQTSTRGDNISRYTTFRSSSSYAPSTLSTSTERFYHQQQTTQRERQKTTPEFPTNPPYNEVTSTQVTRIQSTPRSTSVPYSLSLFN